MKMRDACAFGALLAGAGMSQATAKNNFTTIGTAPASAQIGAISGSTLYGTLPTSGDGVLFSMTTSGAYTALHNFNAASDGSGPRAQLALDGSGNLYGTTGGGGTYGGGTLWEYSAAGQFITLHSFGAGSDGTVPMQGPASDSQGTIYGTTAEGAIGGSGNIFSYAQAPGYDVLYDFMSGQDGHCPFSGLAVSNKGTLYGTTVGLGYGGNPTGSVFKYSASGGLQTLHVFGDGQDGEWPTQAPTIVGKNAIYGTTNTQNGMAFAGAMWRITANGKFSLLHSFKAKSDGFGPNSPLLNDRDLLYGTTVSGGSKNNGTVFYVTTYGLFTLVHSFAGKGDGATPTGNLVAGPKFDAIYGGTATGQVFEITPP